MFGDNATSIEFQREKEAAARKKNGQKKIKCIYCRIGIKLRPFFSHRIHKPAAMSVSFLFAVRVGMLGRTAKSWTASLLYFIKNIFPAAYKNRHIFLLLLFYLSVKYTVKLIFLQLFGLSLNTLRPGLNTLERPFSSLSQLLHLKHSLTAAPTQATHQAKTQSKQSFFQRAGSSLTKISLPSLGSVSQTGRADELPTTAFVRLPSLGDETFDSQEPGTMEPGTLTVYSTSFLSFSYVSYSTSSSHLIFITLDRH